MTPTADNIKALREEHPCISLADAKKLVTLASTAEEAHDMADCLLAGDSMQDLMLEQIATLKNAEMRKKSDKLLDVANRIQEIAECLMNRKTYDSERLETARDVWAYQLIMQADHIREEADEAVSRLGKA